MFRKANIKLTLVYSSLFLVSFWAFSIGLYFWMENYFGESYISEIEQQGESELDEQDMDIANIAADVAQDRLENTLLILNGGMIVIVPVIAWFMTRRTLAPVQRIHEQQKQFVSDVAHELRTPLSIMSGELEVALRKERTLEDYRQVLNSSKQETDRLIELSENLLFLARVDQGRQAIEFEKVDVTDLIGSIIASLQVESTKKEITIHFEPEEEPTFAWGQPAMLRRLFFNLIDNAIQYTPSQGEIWISLATGKQYTQTKIRDTGVGIPPEDQEKIFDRFYRVDPSRSQIKGYGLGLAICKSIVELHHGSITVRSALGKGSTFTVIL
ncbi:MAG: ATP-binding protein, partial [Dehalococcoidia bacterium]|nr:ATP-binding protein [Dehalococcoidia bacterium]